MANTNTSSCAKRFEKDKLTNFTEIHDQANGLCQEIEIGRIKDHSQHATTLPFISCIIYILREEVISTRRSSLLYPLTNSTRATQVWTSASFVPTSPAPNPAWNWRTITRLHQIIHSVTVLYRFTTGCCAWTTSSTTARIELLKSTKLPHGVENERCVEWQAWGQTWSNKLQRCIAYSNQSTTVLLCQSFFEVNFYRFYTW